MDRDANIEAGSEGALRQLRETEERLIAEVRDAESRAARLLEEAGEKARSIREGGNDLDDERRRLQAAIERETEATIAAASDRAAGEERQLRAVDEGHIRELARWVVSRLLAGDHGS